MSTEVSAEVDSEVVPEVVAEESRPRKDEIRAQIKIGQAVRDYVEASEQFGKASIRLNESCKALREIIKPSTTLVVR